MPLRYVRKAFTTENALSVAVGTTAVARELADILQVPPARAAAGVLLLIFKTIQVSILVIMPPFLGLIPRRRFRQTGQNAIV